MNNNLTEIVFVLDKSGSMGSVRNDTIGGFNSFINDQKDIPGQAIFTLALFDHEYSLVHQGKLIEQVEELTIESYHPSGMTALLDAVGKTINDVVARHANLDESERPGKTILVVLTDGEENSSTEFKKASDISSMIKEREDAGWEIVFLGADVDVWQDGAKMGFSKMRGVLKKDMLSNLSKVSSYTASYRTSSADFVGNVELERSFNMSDEEIAKQMKDLKNK